MSKPFDLIEEVKKYLADDYKEGMKLTPSYYVLEEYSKKLLELINRWKDLDPEMSEKLSSLQRKIELFQIDLPGHLKDDLKKGNKRYRANWLTLKDNIEARKNELVTFWKESHGV